MLSFGHFARANKADSLKACLTKADPESRTNLLIRISNAYKNLDWDSCYAYSVLTLQQPLRDDDWPLRLSAYDNLRAYFWQRRSSDTALSMLDSAILMCRRYNSYGDLAYFENSKGICYWKLGIYPKALEAFRDAYEAHEQLNDQDNMAYTLNNLSACYVRLGDYEKALNTALKSMKIKEKKGNELDIAMSLINIGGILVKLDNDDEALTKYLKALAIFKKNNASTYYGKCLNNVGSIYKRKGQFETARHYYLQAQQQFEATGEKENLASAYRYLAAIDIKESKNSAALENYQKSLTLCKAYQDQHGMAISRIGIAEALKNKGDLQGAIRHLKEALTNAEDIGATELKRDAHLSLSECYELQRNTSAALSEYKIYTRLSDSLLNQEKINNMNEMQVRYETEKKEQEIEILKQKNEIDQLEITTQHQKIRQQQHFIIISIVILLLIVTILLLLFNRYRLKQIAIKEKSERKALQLESRLLRTQMNPHFLFNSLNSIQSYISEADTFMAETYLSKFARLIRNILEHSRKNMVPLEDDLDSLKLYLAIEQLRFKNGFDFYIHMTEDLAQEEYFIPPMMIQPFVENAIIHGIRHKNGQGRIDIRLETDNELLTCEIVDNGVGRKFAEEIRQKNGKRPSLGMQVTEERIEVLRREMNRGAEIKIIDLKNENGEPTGTKVILRIPFEKEF